MKGITLAALLGLLVPIWGAAADPFVVETESLRIEISGSGFVSKVLLSPCRCVSVFDGNQKVPIATITQYRPYPNELQLSRTTAPTVFLPTAMDIINSSTIALRFSQLSITVRLKVRQERDYAVFTLDGIEAPKARTAEEVIDELAFFNLPVTGVSARGDWLNTVQVGDFSIGLLGLNPDTFVNTQRLDDRDVLAASAMREPGLEGSAAVFAATNPQLLDLIDRMEREYGLPRGVKSRRSDLYRYSYVGVYDVDPTNVDHYVSYVKRMGLRLAAIYYRSFALGAGHFEWNERYPNGIDDLAHVVEKFREKGIRVGLHFHYTKVDRTDRYVTPLPDPRLNSTRSFTLSKPITSSDRTIYVEQDPQGLSLNSDRALLRIGNELITYSGYSGVGPYKFYVAERGALGTSVSAHPVHERLEKLDVDTWPLFIRIDQSTSLQEELAERIAAIYNAVAFDFAYFDGAEDVAQPYWYNVAKAQLEIYERLHPRPVFSEGAAKAHFSWHILSRSNAFDLFRPEENKNQVSTWPMSEARALELDFSKNNFGWIGAFLPSRDSAGTQPSDIEYTVSRAAGWDSPFSITLNLTKNSRFASFHLLPRRSDIFEIISNWEHVRVNGLLEEAEIEALKNPGQEHILLEYPDGPFKVAHYEQLTGSRSDPRTPHSYMFQVDGERYLVFWHPTGEGEIRLPDALSSVELCEEFVTVCAPVALQDGVRMLAIGDRRFLKLNSVDQASIQRVLEGRYW